MEELRPFPRTPDLNMSTVPIDRLQPVTPWLSADEAATHLRETRKGILHLARTGKLPAHPIGDGQRRRWKFRRDELDAWLSSRNNGVATGAALKGRK